MSEPSSSPFSATATVTKLSKTGKVFFGGLCVGTFALGVWQLERLREKLKLMEDRQQQLDMEPTMSLDDTSSKPYRRRLLQGRLRHDKEVLIGPRGAPSGVQLPVQGLSAKMKKNNSSQQTSSGMSAGPQGYYVLTPLELAEGISDRKLVWINRGWIPKTIVPGADQPYRRQGPVERAKIQEALSTNSAWTRPDGTVNITAVQSQVEKPKYLTPEHDYSKRPLQLFWLDGLALQAIAESNETTMLMTQVLDENEKPDDPMEDSKSKPNGNNSITTPIIYPLQPPLSSMATFRTTPAIHVGYAATWFGLSAAGVYMTRKLITKGRF